ncbi:hypothetical protein Poli38472_002994 [Pythium oligandrum]|uniref:Uncharacterized protein n=1 Tax=Pythium oligandrum TaxID=41045 RepID=A0A8K1C5R1_PYTOL|nr:hypothetical protein Poli38472_002994 [Pythium oligandrum]|eukprot:TMW57069.1 hypothetical protein Poli38472_002994 [Pythium oligandrum]
MATTEAVSLRVALPLSAQCFDRAVEREVVDCWLAHALEAVVGRIASTERVHWVVWTQAPHVHNVHKLFQRVIKQSDALAGQKAIVSAVLEGGVESVRSWLAEERDGVVVVYSDQVLPSTWILECPTSWVWITDVDDAVALERRLEITSQNQSRSLDALRPLHQLEEQCGWRLAMEILTQATATVRPQSTSSSFLASASIQQLPFQVLLMLLRWTYFHPRVLALVATSFTRKLARTPQQRVRNEIHTLYQQQSTLWTHSGEHDSQILQAVAVDTSTMSLSAMHIEEPPQEDEEDDVDDLTRLSQCGLWDIQKDFYRTLGIRAWSDHLIPFGVSSSSYLARQYARTAIDFLVQDKAPVPSTVVPVTPRTPNCFVWEAASGSCKFLHAFLVHFYDLVTEERLEERYGLVPCVIASDLSEQVLLSRQEMTCFQRYISDKRLDFALFDTATFLHGTNDERGSLRLRCQQIRWHLDAQDGPVFFMANYFIDSLRADVFVARRTPADSALVLKEALVDPTTRYIHDLFFCLKKTQAHPRDKPLYDDPRLNKALVQTLDRLDAAWQGARTTQSALILFPVEALELLSTLFAHSRVGILLGDASFSHRDGIPSVLLNDDNGLEIPQLSPHPDCFCLPMDLEILQTFVSLLDSRLHVAASSTPASDTFNLLYASPSSTLSTRFQRSMAQFSPSDCDLLWGMMAVEDGAKFLSNESLRRLLAQTAYDMDLFAVLMWPLYHHWKQCNLGMTDAMTQELIQTGTRCFRKVYTLQDERDSGICRLVLQLARWFYVLGAYDRVCDVLDEYPAWKKSKTLCASVTYLLALAWTRRQDASLALMNLRQSLRFAPTRQTRIKRLAMPLLKILHDQTSDKEGTG